MREIVLDTETTGLSFVEDRIVEIGCVELVDFLPTGKTYHVYVNPQRPSSKRALEIHGLTEEFLKTKRTFKTHCKKFLEFIGDAQLVIHNASFDIGMLNAELSRLDLGPITNPVCDTLALARQVKPGGAHNLDALCKHFGVDNSKRVHHGALLDSEILAAVYLELRGGRQHKLELVEAGGAAEEARPNHGRRRFISRITPAELERHRAFVAGQVKDAMWGEYWKEPPLEAETASRADAAEWLRPVRIRTAGGA